VICTTKSYKLLLSNRVKFLKRDPLKKGSLGIRNFSASSSYRRRKRDATTVIYAKEWRHLSHALSNVKIKALLFGSELLSRISNGALETLLAFSNWIARRKDDCFLRGIVRTEYRIIRGRRNGRADDFTAARGSMKPRPVAS